MRTQTFNTIAAIATIITGSALLCFGLDELTQGCDKENMNSALASQCVNKSNAERACSPEEVKSLVKNLEGKSEQTRGLLAIALGAALYVPAYRKKGDAPAP
jgi:hypothetical protein